MKKTALLLLCIAMLLSVLAGCAKPASVTDNKETQQTQEPKKEETKQDTKEETKQETPKQSWQEEHPSWLCEEKTTLTVFCRDGVSAAYLPPSNDLKFWQWMEEYTNVHIEWEVAPKASYKDVITAKIGGGDDLSDIILIHYAAIKNDAGENGLVLDMSQYWDTCFPNIQAYFKNIGIDYKANLSTPDGELYSLATFANPSDNHIMLLYNTEWMKKLGVEIPSTLDELTDLLYKMKAAGDLNGNGEDDEIILTSSSMSCAESIIGNAFGMQTYLGKTRCQADENGKVYEEYTSENMKAFLTYLNQLYSDGILDPEVTIMDYDILATKCATDRVGVYICYSTFAVDYGQLTPKGVEDPTGEYYTLGLPLASEWNNNEPFYVLDSSFSSHCCLNADLDEEKAKLACRWLDVLYADPTALEVRCLGWEGETFNRNADGSIELIPFPDGQVWQPENFGGGQISLPYIQTSEILNLPYTNEQWYLDESQWVLDNCKFIPMSIVPVTTFTEEENELKSMYENDVLSAYTEYRDKFMMGEMDIESKWDEYLTTLNKLGLDKVVELYQSIYDRTK